MSDISAGRTVHRRTPALLAALVFLVALNLRPSLTSVGPLLPQIGPDEGLGEGALGLLGALPLLAFAAVSPLVHRLARRVGPERAVMYALLVLAAGTLVRSYAGHAGLWVGTVVLGAAIAVGNVLVPTLVKRDYPDRVSVATGVYSAFLATAAAVASAIAVPVAAAVGWHRSLALWCLPALVVAVLWTARLRSARPVIPTEGPQVPAPRSYGSVWRRRTAWLVTVFMGLQSTTFYVLVTWLPTIETAAGTSARQAGIHLFVYQVLGVVGGLLVPRLMRRDTQVPAAVAATVPVLLGVLGLLALPGLGLLWAAVMGLGSGSALVVALSLVGLRSRSHQETTELSGMAQSLGYLLAAGGPVLAGVLAERTGAWHVSLLLLAGVAACQCVVALWVGRPGDGRAATGRPAAG